MKKFTRRQFLVEIVKIGADRVGIHRYAHCTFFQCVAIKFKLAIDARCAQQGVGKPLMKIGKCHIGVRFVDGIGA